MSEIQAVEANPVRSESLPYRLSERGLRVGRPLSLEEWRGAGKRIAGLINGVQWAIGDWLLTIPKDSTWDVSLAEAAEQLQYNTAVLARFRRTAEAFPFSERTVAVSWTHYKDSLVLAPEERMPALRRAEEEGWGVDRFDDYIARGLAAGEIEKVEGDSLYSKAGRKRSIVRCPHCLKSFEARLSLGRDE